MSSTRQLLGFVVHPEHAPSTALGYARIAHLSAPRVTSHGEAPVAERGDDQAAARVGGIRLGMARRAERHQRGRDRSPSPPGRA